MRRGFTLVELMVVVGIIVLLATIAVPSLGPMLSANQEAQVINTLNGMLARIQIDARSGGTPYAIRFERAFKMHERGVMEDAEGETAILHGSAFDGPVWLDYQRARILHYPPSKEYAFKHDAESKLYNLPKGFWIAPGYAIDPNDPDFFSSLVETGLYFDPKTDQSPAANAAPYNRLENFYIVFDGQGELTDTIPTTYADQTQTYLDSMDNIVIPRVKHPDGSARSLLVYDRQQWLNIAPNDHDARWRFLARESKPIYINRALGTIVEGAQ